MTYVYTKRTYNGGVTDVPTIVKVDQAFLYQEYPATQRLPITQTTQEDINPLALR